MVISKKIRRNKTLVVEQPKPEVVRVTLKQQMLDFIKKEDRDLTVNDVLEAFPQTVRRNVEKNLRDFYVNGVVTRNKCRCGSGNLYRFI